MGSAIKQGYAVRALWVRPKPVPIKREQQDEAENKTRACDDTKSIAIKPESSDKPNIHGQEQTNRDKKRATGPYVESQMRWYPEESGLLEEQHHSNRATHPQEPTLPIAACDLEC